MLDGDSVGRFRHDRGKGRLVLVNKNLTGVLQKYGILFFFFFFLMKSNARRGAPE